MWCRFVDGGHDANRPKEEDMPSDNGSVLCAFPVVCLSHMSSVVAWLTILLPIKCHSLCCGPMAMDRTWHGSRGASRFHYSFNCRAPDTEGGRMYCIGLGASSIGEIQWRIDFVKSQ